MTNAVRPRILGGTIDCLGRHGIDKTTVEDVARASGVSRATVYRHFPDGKDEIIAAGIEFAVADFFTEMALAIDDARDLAELLERALLFGHRAVAEHEILQTISRTEPERLMPQLSRSAPLVRRAIADYLSERLQAEPLRPGIRAEEAADWLARMVLSFLFDGGIWDLTDARSVRRLVRDELLAGIVGDGSSA